MTGGGARLLEARLNGAVADVGLVAARQDAVAWFRSGPGRGGRCARLLRRVPDMDRALSRLALDRGGPRDLAAVRDALGLAERVRAALGDGVPGVLAEARAALAGHEGLGRGWRRRWWPSRRRWRGTGGSSRAGSTGSSTRRGGCGTRGGR